jgi:hypothetical protein
MGDFKKEYELERKNSVGGPKFFFESKGQRNVIKIIQYSHVMNFEGNDVYNLGFGDYDSGTGGIIDSVTTNNSDVYTVFNTVLKSVPLFFEEFPGRGIIVSGSDSDSSYISNCRITCLRKCDGDCQSSS